MPPRKGRKRKANDEITDDRPLKAPDRKTWPGWVEIESEPAFFNAMLKDMDVRGVKVNEVFTLDEEQLALLPQPVHALIFLFRYHDSSQAGPDVATKCPEDVWFANQIPDHACATVALLNIVNNCPGLYMSREMRDFAAQTKDLDPVARGTAIDDFAFVKRIHNSFASDTDILNADLALKDKAERAKMKAARAKAQATRKLKAAANGVVKPAPSKQREQPSPGREPSRKSTRTVKSSTNNSSSPLSTPPDSDNDGPFKAPKPRKNVPSSPQDALRRSTRTLKPKQSTKTATTTTTLPVENEGGFHFIAYMPINGHVYALDGLDNFPTLIGSMAPSLSDPFVTTTSTTPPFPSSNENPSPGQGWLSIARPALQSRMAAYENSSIEFNLMAVVHDSAPMDRERLAGNVAALREVEARLDGVVEDWRELEEDADAEDGLVIRGVNGEYGVSEADIARAGLETGTEERLEEAGEDLYGLMKLRKGVLGRQAVLRAGLREAALEAREDEVKAAQRRHDYAGFFRGWLGALAERELLGELVGE